ncbi:YidH family protein [Almyronema epifaneia]|uniref:YidH family protein n=1 Tax=Almyronema epifaneia S1 TaxID=2991925 RepID=A0ABW6IH98_9CYAN
MNRKSPQLPPKYEPPSRHNLNNELAKARNRAAAERTLMAWMRTCLALITFGFGIDQLVTTVDPAIAGASLRLSRLVGLCFVSLGTFAMLAAMLDHQRELKLIQRNDYVYLPRRSLSLLVSAALLLIGAFTFFVILLRLK